MLDCRSISNRSLSRPGKGMQWFSDVSIQNYYFEHHALTLTRYDDWNIWGPFKSEDEDVFIAMIGKVALEGLEWDKAKKSSAYQRKSYGRKKRRVFAMRAYLECIPCFFKQAQDAAQLAGANKSAQKKILKALSKELLKFDLKECPTAMGRILYKLVRQITGRDDPFKKLKRKSNEFALSLYPQLKNKVGASKDRLLAAIELAIAGNIIDYGVKSSLNISREIEKIFAEEDKIIRKESKAVFDYAAFKKGLRKAERILYIGDNAGEIVFDRILIEELKNKEIIFAVRGQPIINDALIEDAKFCGIDKYAQIVSSGCDAPGTILKFCTEKFRKIFKKADFIISKGQGNFEALSGQRRPIFFLFRAKCPVVAKHLGCKLGDIILKKAV